MKLLIVEDEKAQIQAYQDYIEEFNIDNDSPITPAFVTELEKAIELLLNPDFDAAIIDLKLSQDKVELEGKDIIDQIYNKQRIPIFVVSGSVGQIELDENALFKKRERDIAFKDIIDEILAIYNTGITKILGKTGTINDHLNKIFWNHLSNSLDPFIHDKNRTPQQKEKTLLRYTLLHIQEYLELNSESKFEDYSPAEIYIFPPIRNYIFTGDLIRNTETGERFFVLTPSCDLAQTGKTKHYLFAKIYPITEGPIAEQKLIIDTGTRKQREAAEKKIKNILKNSDANKYHFLPKHQHIEAGLIHFQDLQSILITDFSETYETIASTNSSFTKDIIARFSYYYSRQGSPDFDIDELYNSVIN